MSFLPCPRCGSVVEVPGDVIATDDSSHQNVAYCRQCALGFEYDDEEVQFVADPEQMQTA